MQVNPPPTSRARSAAFRALAVVLPLLVVLLAEVVLRWAGAGAVRREPFQPIRGKETYVALDPAFGAMFFRGFQPGVAFDPMAAEKPDGLLRVIALGGSTTAGFPYHWYYGFPARLEDRLAAALPGLKVEVANLGMTATNSYTLWALAPSVVEQRPDAVVIYAGHNEFYGAYGTGGTQGWTGTSVWWKRLLIRSSRWGLVSGIGSLFEGEELPAVERRTMMARVVREASIEAGGETFEAAVDQFETNLRDVLHRFERAGIPVYLATLTSNLADQPPLGDEPEAATAYSRGRELLLEGDTASARAAFMEAKEADGLRFRAPEAMNEVIRRLAREFRSVTLVDMQGTFRSEGAIEGKTLFTDHLHPNARGYSLMAGAYFEAMKATLPALREAYEPDPAPHSTDPIEERLAGLQITILTSGYPFRKDRTPAEAEAVARARTEEMAGSGQYADSLTALCVRESIPMANVLDAAVRFAEEEPDTLAALRLYQALLYWQPFNEPLMERAVGYAIRNPAYDAETAALARYAAIHTGSVFSLNALAAVALRQGDREQAANLLAAVEKLDPGSPEMLYNKARLLVMQGDTMAARRYFERYREAAGS